MNKFSLPTGTTKRHQWQKPALQAIQALERTRFERKELTGLKDINESSHVISTMFGGVENIVADELLTDIGLKFEWQLTKENADAIFLAAVNALSIAQAARPVDDMRETQDQRTDRQTQNRVRNDEHAEKEGRLVIETNKIANELRLKYPWAKAEGTLSGYARAANNMKQELKIAFPATKFSVRSESFSMGDAIRVSWNDGPRSDSVTELTDKYQYYIDKCTNDTSAMAKAVGKVLGSAKYVSTSREISKGLRNQIGHDLCKKYGVEYFENVKIGGHWLSEAINIALDVDIFGEYTGVELSNINYLAQFKSAKVSAIPTSTSTLAHIEEHEHTKKGFVMYMVVPDMRLEKEEFNALRDTAKAGGGWYSRKWGSTPGGFAFEDKDKAEDFLELITGPAPITILPKPKKGVASKLRATAEKMQTAIDSKFADRQTNTPKRQAQAASARFEGERLKRTQSVLVALANMHDAGTIPPTLAGLNSKKSVYDLMSEGYSQVPNGYHSFVVGNGQPYDSDALTLLTWELLTPKSDKDIKADELKRQIESLQFSKISGYFPTPQAVIETMLDYADLNKTHRVLEPSAGSGAICDAVANILGGDGEIICFEVNHTLCEILLNKGYDVHGHDFTENLSFLGLFDRVLMNPPFENLQDIEHIQRAFSLLKSGGRLVSVMSPSAFFRSDKKSVAFREWFEKLGGEKIELPDRSFKESGTNINTVLVIIDN